MGNEQLSLEGINDRQATSLDIDLVSKEIGDSATFFCDPGIEKQSVWTETVGRTSRSNQALALRHIAIARSLLQKVNNKTNKVQ